MLLEVPTYIVPKITSLMNYLFTGRPCTYSVSVPVFKTPADQHYYGPGAKQPKIGSSDGFRVKIIEAFPHDSGTSCLTQ